MLEVLAAGTLEVLAAALGGRPREGAAGQRVCRAHAMVEVQDANASEWRSCWRRVQQLR
jgi:hypothetical protein